MRKVILQIELESERPTIKSVKRELNLRTSQIDSSFGVKPVRPAQKLYAIRVDADVAERLEPQQRARARTTRADDIPVVLVH